MARPPSAKFDAYEDAVQRLPGIPGISKATVYRVTRLLRQASKETADWGMLRREAMAGVLELLALLPTWRDGRTRVRGYSELARLLKILGVRELGVGGAFGAPLAELPRRPGMWMGRKDEGNDAA